MEVVVIKAVNLDLYHPGCLIKANMMVIIKIFHLMKNKGKKNRAQKERKKS